MFGLTASAEDEATTFKVEFKLNMDKGYKDIKITDTNGKIITGFCLAVSDDGFFPFIREDDSNAAHNGGKSMAGTPGAVTGFEGAGVEADKKVKMWYTKGETKVTIDITNDTEGNSYTVAYSVEGALAPNTKTPLTGYKVLRTYTEGTAGAIATPDKWVAYGDHGPGNDDLTPKTICNYLTDMTITNGDSVAESKTVTVTYDGDMSSKSFTYTAPVGTTVDIPAYAVLDGTAENAVIKSWKYTSSTEEIKEDKTIDIKMEKIDAMASYAFNATDKAKTVVEGYGDAELKNETYLDFSDNGYVTYNGNGTDFKGTGVGYVDLPASIVQALNGNYTISMWVKQDGGTSSTTAFWDMCQDDTGSNNNNRIFMQRTYDGKLNIRYRPIDAGPNTNINGINQTDGKWALITASFDLTDTKRLTTYVNGTAYKNDQEWTTKNAPSVVYDLNKEKQVFHLGRNQWARDSSDSTKTANPSLNGSIADVRIYNSALTAEEVAALMGVKRTATIKYVSGDTEIAPSTTVETFSDKVAFDIPQQFTYNDTIYVPAENKESDEKSYAEEIKVQYKKADVAVAEGSKEITLTSETIIDGNVPAAQTVEITTAEESIKYIGKIDWESVKGELKYTDGQPKTVIAPVKSDNVQDGTVKAKINVTVLPCTDDSLAKEPIESSATDTGHAFSPVAGKATFEFDVTFSRLDGMSANAGDHGVFFGERVFTLPAFTSQTPAFTGAGNAIGIQGTAKGKFIFKKGNGSGGADSATDRAFSVNLNEKYRILVNADTENDNYTAIIYDSDGQIVKEENEALAFRKTVDKLDTLVTSTNAHTDSSFVVENFRVSWTDDEKYAVVKADYKAEGVDGLNKSLAKVVKNGETATFEALAYKGDAKTNPSITGNYIWKAQEWQESVGEDKDITIDLVKNDNANAGDLKKGGIYSWDGKVYSKPSNKETPLDVKDTGAKTYRIVSDNLIPNGTFTDGTLGYYYYSDGLQPLGAEFTVDNNAISPTKNEGQESKYSILTGWDVEKGKTYLFTMDVNADFRSGVKACYHQYGTYETSFPKTGVLSNTFGPEIIKDGTYHSVQTICESDSKIFEISLYWLDERVNASGGENAAQVYYKNFGLYEVEEIPAPEAPTPELGWNGENFTINFTGEAGQTIKVYHENDNGDGTMIEVKDGSKELTEGNTTVAVVPGNTNRIYTATVTADVEGAEGVSIESLQSEKASVYSLVVDALVAEGEGSVDSNKLEAVNKVISSGGVYFEGDTLAEGTELKEKTADIMTVTAENEVTINAALIALNVGFVYNDGNLYVGTGKNAAGAADGTYSKLTIGDGTVTLGGKIENGKVQSNETVTLSLDAVNIEFVETLVEELEANGVDAEMGLTPEL